MGKVTTLFSAMGLGAGLMYLYDPQNGERRRQLLRERGLLALQLADQTLGTGVREIEDRARTLADDTRAMVKDRRVPDRIRDALETVRTHPRLPAPEGGPPADEPVLLSAAGGLLLLYGVLHRGLTGMLASVVGLSLLTGSPEDLGLQIQDGQGGRAIEGGQGRETAEGRDVGATTDQPQTAEGSDAGAPGTPSGGRRQGRRQEPRGQGQMPG